MEKSDERIENVGESNVSAAEVPKMANRAVKDTAQKYLNAAGIKIDLADIEGKLRDRALFSLGIAASIGFILGGGLATKPGVMLLGLLGRTAVRQTATKVGRQVLQQAGSQS